MAKRATKTHLLPFKKAKVRVSFYTMDHISPLPDSTALPPIPNDWELLWEEDPETGKGHYTVDFDQLAEFMRDRFEGEDPAVDQIKSCFICILRPARRRIPNSNDMTIIEWADYVLAHPDQFPEIKFSSAFLEAHQRKLAQQENLSLTEAICEQTTDRTSEVLAQG